MDFGASEGEREVIVDFFDLYRAIMDGRGLSQPEGMVLLGLLRTVDAKKGWVGWFAQEQLAVWAKMTDRGLRKVLPRLEARGLISLRKGGPNGTYIATLNVSAIMTLPEAVEVLPVLGEQETTADDTTPSPADAEPGTTFHPEPGSTRNPVPGGAERGSGGGGTPFRVDPEPGSYTVSLSVPLSVPRTVPPHVREAGPVIDPPRQLPDPTPLGEVVLTLNGRPVPPDLLALGIPYALARRLIELSFLPTPARLLRVASVEDLRRAPGMGEQRAQHIADLCAEAGYPLGCVGAAVPVVAIAAFDWSDPDTWPGDMDPGQFATWPAAARVAVPTKFQRFVPGVGVRP